MPHEAMVSTAGAAAVTQGASGSIADATSRIAGLHVTVSGTGPDVLLLHGTAASGASWHRLLPSLSEHCRVVVPDLPGHGRSADAGPVGYSPDAMRRSLLRMLEALQVRPQLVIGHSAGAALGAGLMLDGMSRDAGLIAVAPAMLGFRGVRQFLFGGLAGLLAANPLVPWAVSWKARDRDAVERLLRGIGTDLDRAGVERYAGLLRQPGHVAAVLKMMAQWDLRPLERRLPELGERVLLITGNRDGAVPDPEIRRLQSLLPGAARVRIDAGHLVHEEQPAAVLAAIRDWSARYGVLL
jgi:magnesium chelatase accessory protein